MNGLRRTLLDLSYFRGSHTSVNVNKFYDPVFFISERKCPHRNISEALPAAAEL